jgi:flagellar hook protein FlgE
MLRSLFAGISGLRVNQTMLDVTGNNIANANTIGFKGSTTIFQDTLSQMLNGASAVSPPRGGTNPTQVGLGVQLAGISTNMTQGSAQTTGRATDLMLQGDGFFVVQRGNETLYTRAGAFNFDGGDPNAAPPQPSDPCLVTPSGNRVMGYAIGADGNATGGLVPVTLPRSRAVDADGNPGTPPTVEDVQSYNIGQDGKLRAVYGGVQVELAQLAIADFANPQGLEKVGETAYRASASSGQADINVSGVGGRGIMMAGTVEMSNVDLAAEFTNLILAQRGFQASSRIITTSDQVLEDLVNIKR